MYILQTRYHRLVVTLTEQQPATSDEPINEFAIKTRVDLARVAFYRSFLEAKSGDDVYFEHLLTIFLALAQQPLNFCLFKRAHNESGQPLLLPLFHFCTDKKHIADFEAYIFHNILAPPQSSTDLLLFPLFPDLLGEDQYYISVHFMQTRDQNGDDRFRAIKSLSRVSELNDNYEYVSICAQHYFSLPWDSFKTRFGAHFCSGIKSSLDKLKDNHAWTDANITTLLFHHIPQWKNGEYPPLSKNLIRLQQDVKHPNQDRETWHKTVRKVLSPTLRSTRFSSDALSGLMYDEPQKYWPSQDLLSQSPHPTNMLVAYRSFDRDTTDLDDCGRNSTDSCDGYPYNVRFLFEDIESPLESERGDNEALKYFRFLGQTYGGAPEGYERPSLTGHSPRIKRYLFRNLPEPDDLNLDGPENRNFVAALCSFADLNFWTTLGSDGSGADECLVFLATPIGNTSRSMVDPVMNTGLVHFNKIFAKAGLDRISLESVHKAKRQAFVELYDRYANGQLSWRQLVEEGVEGETGIGTALFKELKRIVSFYYLFCGMAAGAITGRNSDVQYDIRNVTAVLSPIKLLGSTWGVSIHATFMNENTFRNRSIWMYHFFLLTLQSKNFTYLVDKALWKNVENRISRLIVRHLDAAFSMADSTLKNNQRRFLDAIKEVNTKIQQEQQLIPYALPVIKIFPRRGEDAELKRYIWSCNIDSSKQSDAEFPQIRWMIRRNEFFIARQAWNGRGTRRFSDSIEIGMRRGLALVEARLSAIERKRK